MSAVIINAPRYYTDDGWPAVTATITIGSRRHNVIFRASQGPLRQDAAPFAILALFPAMTLGVPLRVTTPIPSALRDHLHETQDVILSDLPNMHRVAIEAQVMADAPTDSARGVACFFSGGVDSTYTLLKHQAEIDHLIFVHGFDVPLTNKRLRETVTSAIHREATEFGKPVIEVETNARDFISPYLKDWVWGIGPSAAAVAYLLSPFLHTVYMASGLDYGIQPHANMYRQWYQLFSTPLLQISDDGREAMRFQKVALLTQNETAMRWLRVCYENPHNAYNCGHCAKCLQTMLSLKLVDALDKCQTFPHTIDLAAVRRATPQGGELVFTMQAMIAAVKLGTHPDIVAALSDCLGVAPTTTPDHTAIELAIARRRVNILRGQLEQATNSYSWRLTAPLRALGSGVRALRRMTR